MKLFQLMFEAKFLILLSFIKSKFSNEFVYLKNKFWWLIGNVLGSVWEYFYHVSHAFKLINRSNRSMKPPPQKKYLMLKFIMKVEMKKKFKKKYDTQLFEQ